MPAAKFWDGTTWQTIAAVQGPTGAQGPQGIQGLQGPVGGNATVPMDTWHTVGGVGEPAFVAGWSAIAPESVAFRKFPDGIVRIKGFVQGPVDGGVVFTLPVGYRPPSTYFIRTIIEGESASFVTHARAYVDKTTGAVTIDRSDSVAGNFKWDLAPLTFDTETVTAMPTGPAGVAGVAGATGGQVYTQLIGDGVATSFTVGHNLHTRAVTVSAYRTSAPYDEVEADVERSGIDTVTIRTSPTVPATNEYTVVVAAAGTLLNPPAISTAPPTVSALPSSPVDGQEVYFVADATNGVMWHLRYRAASASAYKWEFVGGSPLVVRSISGVGYTTGGSYVFGPALAAPQITLPLAGDWDVWFVLNLQVAAAVNDWRAAAFCGGAQLSGSGAMGATAAAMFGTNLTDEQIKAGASAGQVLDMRVSASAASATCTVYDRSLRAQPVRVG